MHDDDDLEQEAARLLAPLRGDVPEGPDGGGRGGASGVDVQRAVSDGRRRLRVRRVTVPAAAAALLVAVMLTLALLVRGVPDGQEAPPAHRPSPSGPAPSSVTGTPTPSGTDGPTRTPTRTPTGSPTGRLTETPTETPSRSPSDTSDPGSTNTPSSGADSSSTATDLARSGSPE